VDPANGGAKIDMKRNWNWSLWIGFVFVLVVLFSYNFFVQFPVTRDFPWANFLLFGVGGILLVPVLSALLADRKLIEAKSSDRYSRF
jgi:hypothetical protein